MSDSTKCVCGKTVKNCGNRFNFEKHIKSCAINKKSHMQKSMFDYFENPAKKPKLMEIDSISIGENASSTSDSIMHNETIDQCAPTADAIESVLPVNGPSFDALNTEQNLNNQLENTTTVINDPAKFSKLTRYPNEVTDYILKLGPCQPTAKDLPGQDFPRNKNHRSFHVAYYFKKLPDLTASRRDWLSYSPSEDKIFCLHCMLFAQNGEKAWATNGFNNWTKLNQSLILHETSSKHADASVKAKIREVSIPLIPSLEESKNQTVSINREIVRHLIDATLYLARHCVAFRGHRDSLKENLHGNFLDLILLLSEYSPAMSVYVDLLNAKKENNSLLHWRRQNELIHSVAKFIRDHVVQELKEAPFFSICMDTTFDKSRKEQLCFVVRYVNEQSGKVEERLLTVEKCTFGTSSKLFEKFEEICKEFNLDWRNYLVGQSYDGASNMRGEENGVQAHITAENPRAVYIWCYAHRLALIVKDAVACCINAINLFSNLEAAFTIVCSSKKRVEMFENFQKERYPKNRVRRLKRVSTTRWMSQERSLLTTLDTIDALLDVLEYVYTLKETEHTVKSTVKGLIEYFQSEIFFLTAFLFKKIFEQLAPLNLLFQKKDVDLLAAANVMESHRENIGKLRSEVNFNAIQLEYKDFVKKTSIDNITPLQKTRLRRRKKMPGELASDEPIEDPLESFKINTFYYCIDYLNTEIKQRFSNTNLGIYKDLSLFSNSRIKEIRENVSFLPNDAFQIFAKTYSKFVDREKLVSEYKQFIMIYDEMKSALKLPEVLHTEREKVNEDVANDESSDWDGDVDLMSDLESDTVEDSQNHRNSLVKIFQIFCEKRLSCLFPVLHVALKIAVTIPVASASCERSFSKLKLIKTRLRSTMANDRLSDLMVIACEQDIPVDKEVVTDIFAKQAPILTKMLVY